MSAPDREELEGLRKFQSQVKQAYATHGFVGLVTHLKQELAVDIDHDEAAQLFANLGYPEMAEASQEEVVEATEPEKEPELTLEEAVKIALEKEEAEEKELEQAIIEAVKKSEEA